MCNKKVIVWTIIIALLGGGIFWIYRTQYTKPKIAHVAPTIVTLAPITYHTSEKTVKAYGTTVSPTSMVIRAQDNAEVTSIDFTPGQLVKKRQLLFHLKVSEIGNQQQKLKAQMQQSKSYYMRLIRMNKQHPGIVANFNVLKAKTAYEQDLASYNQLLELENIRAPIAGVISDTHYSMGDMVTAGNELARITDPTSLQVKYQLPSEYAKKAQVGQSIRFYPDGIAHVYSGKISYVSPQFDSNSYNLTIRANLDDFSGLKPNHFGQVVQTTNPHYRTLTLPQGLVHSDAKGFYIYIVINHKINKQYFTPGAVTKTGLVQILSGIPTNTLVVNSNQSVLNVGQTVQVGTT